MRNSSQHIKFGSFFLILHSLNYVPEFPFQIQSHYSLEQVLTPGCLRWPCNKFGLVGTLNMLLCASSPGKIALYYFMLGITCGDQTLHSTITPKIDLTGCLKHAKQQYHTLLPQGGEQKMLLKLGVLADQSIFFANKKLNDNEL